MSSGRLPYAFPALTELALRLVPKAGEGSDYTYDEQLTDAAKKDVEENYVSPYKVQSLPGAQEYVREDILDDPGLMVPAPGSTDETAMLRANMEAAKGGVIRAQRDTDYFPSGDDPRVSSRTSRLLQKHAGGALRGMVSPQQAAIVQGTMRQAARGEGEQAMRRATGYASIPTQFIGEELGIGKAIDLGMGAARAMRSPVDPADLRREKELLAEMYPPDPDMPKGLTATDARTRQLPKGLAQAYDPSSRRIVVDLEIEKDVLTMSKNELAALDAAHKSGRLPDSQYLELSTPIREAIPRIEKRIKNLEQEVVEQTPVRGPDVIEERLVKARGQGKLSPESTKPALEWVRENPHLYEDTAISIRKARTKPYGGKPVDSAAAGTFNNVDNRVTLRYDRIGRFDDIPTHELAHVPERMLPLDVRERIRSAYKQATIARAKDISPVDEPEVRRAFMEAAEGLPKLLLQLRNRALNQIKPPELRNPLLPELTDAQLDLLEDSYQFTNPSEFWAVNAARIIHDRSAAQSGLASRIKNWASETSSILKGKLNLDDRAPLIEGLNNLSSGKGVYQHPLMLRQTLRDADDLMRGRTVRDKTPGFQQSGSISSAPEVPNIGEALRLRRQAAKLATRANRAADITDPLYDTAPFQQTLEEFMQAMTPLKEGETYPAQHEALLRALHEMRVDKAIEEGRAVPAKVLAQYKRLLRRRRPDAEDFGTKTQVELIQNADSPALQAIRDEEKAGAFVVGEGAEAVQEGRPGSVIGITNHFEKRHLAETGRMLNPYDNPKDFQTIKRRMVEELEFQMSGAKSGKEWYDESVYHAFQMAAKQFDEMNYSEPSRVILSAMAAIMSPGQNAKRNWQIAMEAYEAYKKTGSISGFQRLSPAVRGGKRYGQGNTQGLRWLDYLLKTKGEKETAQWMLSPHTVRSLRDEKRAYAKWARDKYSNLSPEEVKDLAAEHGYRPKRGNKFTAKEIDSMIYKDTVNVTQVGHLKHLALGADSFGPKVGPFMKNINGLYDVTGDVWAIRTVRRHMGDGMTIDVKETAKALGVDPKDFSPERYAKDKKSYQEYLDKRVIKRNKRKGTLDTVEAPTGPREREMLKKLFNEVGDATGLKGYQAQAVLWYFEQKLYRNLGGKQISFSFPEGGAKYLSDRGIDFSDIPYEHLVHNPADDVLTGTLKD